MTRLATLNLWWEETAVDARLEAAVAVLDEAAAEVVCLQEVRWDADGVSVADRLAAMLGMRVAGDFAHRVHPDGTRTGLAVLTSGRADTVDVSSVAHPQSAVRVHVDGTVGDHDVPVGFLAVRLAGDDPTWGALKGSWVVTTHLSWGLGNEARRLAECMALDELGARLAGEVVGCVNPGAGPVAVVAAGDCNATAEGDALGFLHGRVVRDGRSTYWVDAWAAVHGPSGGETSVPTDMWAVKVAGRHGLDPGAVPARRIDHVLVRGWRHGRAGSVRDAWVIGAEMVVTSGGAVMASDHRGVCVELLS